jgi:chromosome segregation ATPase
MSSLLKNLTGRAAKDRELTDEMRAILLQIQQECARYEVLVDRARTSAERLEHLSEPIAKVSGETAAVESHLGELKDRLSSLAPVVEQFQTLEEKAAILSADHERAGTEITSALEETKRIRTVSESIGEKIQAALELETRLDSFLEIDKPFQVLRGDSEALRGQLEQTSDHLARLREQYDRLVDDQKATNSKVEALEKRRDDLGRSLADKERRMVTVEEAARGIDSVRHRADDVRREMGALKAMADFVAQKTATLEAQSEAAERVLAQAGELERAMRQIDTGIRQQQENEKTFYSLQEQVQSLRSLHDAVLERSSEITQLQREMDERVQSARHEMAAATDETKKSVERFDFERRGLESATQRVADLRASLADCEDRFRGVNDSKIAVKEIDAQTNALAGRLQSLTAEAASIDSEIAKLQVIRRELEETGSSAREVGARVARIEELRPAVESALRDLQGLTGAHAAVRDALDQAQSAHGEISRLRDAQSQTRTWLADVECAANELRRQVDSLTAMTPEIDFAEKQTKRIGDSLASIEARREFVESHDRRRADLEGLSTRLDERGGELASRMAAAEQRFGGLESHAEEADRMTKTIAHVSSSLSKAGKEADEIKKTVSAAAARAESVESLAEASVALKEELESKKRAVHETLKDLKRATALREETAAAAQQLEELSEKLGGAIASTEQRVTKAGDLAAKLEDRGAHLRVVEKRLDQFEERLQQWDTVDQEVTRSLEYLSSRQDTIDSLRADLDRMFSVADQTVTGVREITSAHAEIARSRSVLNELMVELKTVRDSSGELEERKRQIAKAEGRLARAEGLLVDVRSSIEALQGQKALVDQAVEKAGSLQFLLKQAEATIDGLREERRTSDRVRSAVAVAGQDDEDDEMEAKAA